MPSLLNECKKKVAQSYGKTSHSLTLRTSRVNKVFLKIIMLLCLVVHLGEKPGVANKQHHHLTLGPVRIKFPVID